ncbi:hypothetical protein IY41_19170 [Phocaeicola dorei]|uniref:Uncharacterized protein n=4 Tax=Bacteroidaceae TaxID=815 RepID=A0A3E4WAR4_PHOVU|nr:hypothetical protein [Bacteroides salyersiae]ALA75351.1 hypothetical protein IY41_19170 [Phocaeicola dorei]KAB4253825.1 hypothetical protein GAP49_05535 [Bacteroides uniformis]RGM39287.1 hypothetical protein DXC16_20620 [Phocaeicola vulgatus]KAB4254098.1 hypothetical protein GAO04_06440 [Bacteroides uniformis]KAB4257666.1 hypothetical protein GAP48_04160 [Bacteroides uniformis]
MIVPGYGSGPSSDVIICHQMSWKSDFNIHFLLVNRRSDPFPKSGKFPVRIFVKSSPSDRSNNMNNAANPANRTRPFHTVCYYRFICFRQPGKRVDRAHSINHLKSMYNEK